MYRKVQRLKTRIKSLKKDGTLLGQLLVNDPVCFRAWVKSIPEIDRSFGKEGRQQLTNSILIIQESSELFARSWVDFLTKDFLRLSLANQRRVWGIAKDLLEKPAFLNLLQGEFLSLLERYSDQELKAYLMEAEELFAESVEKARFFLRQESQRSRNSQKQLQKITSLEDYHQILLLYGRARSGEHFQLLSTREQVAYCDGRHVVLPEILPFPVEIGEKFYRLLMAKNSGFLEFGTMDIFLDELAFENWEWAASRDEELEIERLFRSFPSGLLAKEIFFLLENYRIEHALRAEYVGIRILFDNYSELLENWSQPRSVRTAIEKELFNFKYWLGNHEHPWSFLTDEEKDACQKLAQLTSGVADSIQLLLELFPRFYECLLSQEVKDDGSENIQMGRSSSIQTNRLSNKDRKAEKRTEKLQKEMRVQGVSLTRQKARELDFAESSEFLERNPGMSAPRENEAADIENNFTMELSKTMTPLEGEFTYPEWDIRIEDWKPDWTRVREFILPSDHGAFQKEFFGEFHADIHRVKRIFQALRLEQLKPLRKQWDGDQIEFDKLLDASIAIQTNQDPDLRIYQKTHRNLRDIGVAFLVDMSSSTNELIDRGGKRIIDIEKQALFLIAEALYSLGDPFAIYGFSGFGREQVAFYIAKEMGQAWNEETQARLGAMAWKMENRDGAAIRHCTAKMKSWSQKQKLLILLSDGKPLDCASGEYQEELAQRDTWWALQEAKQQGIRPFCITVDPHGKEYLEKMFGQGSYIAISSIETLPRKLPLIYRQLTGLGH